MNQSVASHEIVGRWLTAFNSNDLRPFRTLCRDDVVVHAAAPVDGAPTGLARVAMLLDAYRAAFPEGRFSVEDVSSQGSLTSCRWVARGVNTGTFLYLPPTSREVVVTGTCKFRVVDGLVAEHSLDFNLYDVFAQLGALMPEPERSPASVRSRHERAMTAWVDALRASTPIPADVFAEQVAVRAHCFQRRSAGAGTAWLEQLAQSIRSQLADLDVVVKDCIGQGATATHRASVSGRPGTAIERVTIRMDCMSRTSADRVVEFWIRAGRIA